MRFNNFSHILGISVLGFHLNKFHFVQQADYGV